MKRLIVHIALFFIAFSAVAQNPFSGSSKSVYWDAEVYYEKGDLLNAIDLFKSIYNEKPNNPQLNFYIGDSYFQLKKYNLAGLYLEKAKKINDTYYELAYSNLHHGDSEAAADALKSYAWSPQSKFTEFEARQLESNISNYKKFSNDPEVVNIINLGTTINTEADEYVPLISSDESLLLFTSKREDGSGRDALGRLYEDIYSSINNKNGGFDWSVAQKIKGEVNTPLNDACVGLSPDGNTMFLFRSNSNLIGGDLYESKFIDGEWSMPIIMSDKINGALSIEPSASISLDGKTFYFSSNKEGGFGGFDLYRVIRFPNGEWSDAVNLGEGVNTPLDEDAPFIHPDGKTLYFSSKGHENMGGFDVFKAQFIDEKWTNTTNLGAPTNTSKDDIYFTISANEKHGYYSSAKEGGFGGQDIYVIDYLEKSLHKSVISVQVFIGDMPSFTNISLIDMKSKELVGVFRSHPETGNFILLVNPDVEYELIIEGDGFESYSETISYTVEELLHKEKKIIKIKGGGK